MPFYTSFALVGSGGLGGHILSAFAATPNVSLLVLTRSASLKTLPEGVKVEQVDYTDVSSIASALKKHNVEVVISTIGTEAIEAQFKLCDAAQTAGVKLFVPSEFGVVNIGRGISQPKDNISEYLKTIGLPSAIFFTGLFNSYVPWIISLGINGKANILGKGQTPLSSTDLADIGGFVAHVLTTLSPSDLQDKVFRIQGDRFTLGEAAAWYKTDIVQLADDADVIPYTRVLLKWVEEGSASVAWDPVTGKDDEGLLSNHLWPDHQWKSAKETLGL